MNKPKYLFIGLLLSVSATAFVNSCSLSCLPSSCNTGCSTGCDTSCDSSCNVSCDVSVNCSNGCSFDKLSGSYCTSLSCEDTNYRPGFILRPFTADQTLENALFFYDVYHNHEGRKDDSRVDFQATYFHRSSRSKSSGAGLLLGKNTLLINQAGTGDINSLWLGLANAAGDFSTSFSYNPTYKVDLPICNPIGLRLLQRQDKELKKYRT